MRERQRDRETERQTDRHRQTGRQIDRQTDRQTDRQRERQRQRQRIRDREKIMALTYVGNGGVLDLLIGRGIANGHGQVHVLPPAAAIVALRKEGARRVRLGGEDEREAAFRVGHDNGRHQDAAPLCVVQ